MSTIDGATASDPDGVAGRRIGADLDSEPEESFDRFTRLACRFLDVPAAFVSLAAGGRQFVKSSVGLPAALREPRETSPLLPLASRPLEEAETVSFDDLSEARVPGVREVQRETGLSSSLGAPLVTKDGACLGSLNVLDEVSRKWTPEESKLLRDLAAAVTTEIEVRLQSAERQQALRTSRERLEALSEGVTIHGADGEIIYANRAAEEILGLERSELTSRAYDDPKWEITTPDGEPIPPEDLPAARAVRDGLAVRNSPMAVARPDDGPVILSVNAVPVRNPDGSVREAIVSFRDVTEQKRAEERLRESEERYRRIFENSVAGIYRSRPAGEIIDCNPAFAEMFGFDTPAEATGTPGDEFFFSAETRRRENRRLAEAGRMRNVEMRLRRQDGEPIWVLANSVMVEDPDSGESIIHGTMVDVTGRKRAQERYRRLFDQGVAAVFRSEHEPPARILECNRAFADMFGFESPEEAVGTEARELYPNPEDRERAMEDIRDGGRRFDDAFELRRRDGSPVWVMGETRLVHDPEMGVVNEGLMLDVSDRVRARRQLRHQALHDPLTGLANRTLLSDRVEQGLARARRHGEPLGLLMLDVNHFKRINDRLGHAAGDRVLEGLARRLLGVVRDEDTVARWGGDEFVVVLPEMEEFRSIEAVQERIRDAVRRPIEAGGESLHIDVSVGGVVRAEEDGARAVQTDEADELIRFGDLALHRAKEQPAGSFYLFDPDEEVQGAAQIRLEQALREAVADGQIVPYYQPIVRLEDGEPVGFETLARWRHPERGLVPPAEFIPLAEELELIGALGESVLHQGVSWAADWIARNGGSGPSISFNMSGQQFEDPHVAQTVSDLLAEADVPPERVVLEVTETSLMQAPARIRQLQDLGLSIHVDDFGTGYSTFAYLRDLVLSGLKVDRAFVRDIVSNDSDAALVETVLTLGRRMDLTVVAEGIETEEQRERLLELGCEYGQGFLFAEPMPAAECGGWLPAG